MTQRLVSRALLAGVLTMVLAIFSRGAALQVPGDYATIQQAIDAAEPGDEIRVAAGVYLENLTIAKQGIHLLGAGDETTIVDGNGARETVLISGDTHLGSSPLAA